MSDDLTKGDHVSWRSHGGTAEGEVEKKITSDTETAGWKVRAAKEDPQYLAKEDPQYLAKEDPQYLVKEAPQYLVKSEKPGGEAVHKPSALHKGEE